MKTNDRVQARAGTQLALVVGEGTLGWIDRLYDDQERPEAAVVWDSKHTTWELGDELEPAPHTDQELRDFRRAQSLVWEHCEAFTLGPWASMPVINPYRDSFGCSPQCIVHGGLPAQYTENR